MKPRINTHPLYAKMPKAIRDLRQKAATHERERQRQQWREQRLKEQIRQAPGR